MGYDRGRIYTEYWIMCMCGHDGALGSRTKTRASKDARKLGWKLTKQYGWRCPECLLTADREGG